MKSKYTHYLAVCFFFLSINSLLAQNFDVLKYKIHLKTTSVQNKDITAHTEIKYRSEVDNLSSIDLMLQSLQVDSVLWAAVPLVYTHNGNLLHITLNSPLALGAEDSLQVYYHGGAQTDASGWGGVYASQGYLFNLGVSMSESPHAYGRVWFPCVDNFTDKALYDYHITCPNNLKAVCGGTLVSETDNGDGSHTFFWSLQRPISSYLAAFAVGKYHSYSVNFTSQGEDLPVLIYSKPSDTAHVEGSFAHLEDALHCFENRFGKYAWSRIGYVGVPFNSGAMEHAENIAYPNSSINGNLSQETLMAHEFSHHWFGNLVTCDSAKDMWLNEGWASYCEALFLEDIYGLKRAQDYNRERHAKNLQYLHYQEDEYRPVSNIPDNLTYSSHVYKKGADVVHSLRHYLSDTTFNRVIKAYLQHYQYQNANSETLRDFISSHCGINVDAFFQDWVFTGGWLHFSIDSFKTETWGSKYKTQVFIRQKLKGRDTYGQNNRVPIQFMNASFERKDTVIEFSGITGQQTFTLPFEPKAVFCDLDEQLSDATTDGAYFFKNIEEKEFPKTFFKSKCTQVSDSAYLRVQHHWVAPDPIYPSIEGLIIHPERYWSIEGVFSDDFKADGQFYFNRLSTVKLDNQLISGSSDSLVLLFRPSHSDNWTVVAEQSSRRAFSGYIKVDELKKGDYALAVKNGYTGMQTKEEDSGLQLYPNPTKETLTIKQTGHTTYKKLILLDASGKKLMEQPIRKPDFNLDMSRFKQGIYFVKLEAKQTLLLRKIVKK